MQKHTNSRAVRAPHTRGGVINACRPLDSAHTLQEDCLKILRGTGKFLRVQKISSQIKQFQLKMLART